MQLHGFSDASEAAYTAVVYLRVSDGIGNVHVSLMTSKSKVAPIKHLTIPRLALWSLHSVTVAASFKGCIALAYE